MKLPRSFYNWLSITGLILVVNSLVLILILFIIALLSKESNSYMGVYIYIVLPAFLVLGLILIPIGMLKKVRKVETPEEQALRWPVFNMNLKNHRNSLIKVSIVTFLFLIASAMGSYQAFHYTESVDFCGKLCHSVMEPEHTTYLNSSHARVACVECHVGEGASWYVKSKLSGLYQVYSVLFHKYPKPIPTPVMALRPARETCEKCHWPQKFYAQKLRSQLGFLSDSLNSDWGISLLMKVGPKYSAYGLTEGIHWHINPDYKIEYAASTPDRESIPWVKMTNLKTGEVQIFQDEENMLDKKTLDTLPKRTMDCMDCHNRPSHLFKSAPVYVDNAMITGLIPKDIPFIKKAAMQALKDPFTSLDTAMTSIRDSIRVFYQKKYPVIYSGFKQKIEIAINAIQEEYRKNAFPGMHADASRYLNHIGHLESDGCFRCHSGRHKSNKGVVISRDCNLCHTIIAQGPENKKAVTSIDQSLEFVHPINIKDAWKKGFCSDCHRALYE